MRCFSGCCLAAPCFFVILLTMYKIHEQEYNEKYILLVPAMLDACRGLYPSIARKLPEGRIVSVDVDASASKLNAYNRIKMLIDNPL